MYSGYMAFSQTEIANNERVVAYLLGNPALGIPGLRQPNMSVAASCGCTNARDLYCDPGSGPDGEYLSPRLDDAPWFDPDVPDSEEFAGFFIEDITGFDSTVRREFSDGAISGGSLGPLRLAGRCLTVTGWLLAKTCCGAEYGLRWLQESLMGANACDGCAYGDLYMLKCCPPESDNCHQDQVGATETVPATDIGFRITDLGGGIYEFYIDDALQANVVSDPAGVPTNDDGAIPACYAATNSFRFVFNDVVGATFIFLVPYEAITSFITGASGIGADLTFQVDTNVVGSCDDATRQIANFTKQLSDYFLTYASGDDVVMTTPTDVTCYELIDGYDPDDYIRLLHRVGLTEGPTVLERMGTCCQNECGCTSIKVEFTICSESPYIFSDIEWCLDRETFDLDECYCLDLRDICDNCRTDNSTKFVEREVRRPRCNITLRHDGTWCKEDWPDDIEDCPPVNCELVIGTLEEFTPDDTADTTSGTLRGNQRLEVDLHSDFTWSGTNFNPSEGFLPVAADIYINGGPHCVNEETPGCQDSGSSDCDFFFTVDPFPTFTGTPSFWHPDINGFPPGPCQVTVVPGICECPETGKAPDGATIFPDGSWYDPDNCNYGCDPCGDCNPCKDDNTPKNCPIRLIWNKATNTYRFEILRTLAGAGGATGYGDCDCFQITEYCVEGVEPCLVRLLWDQSTDSATWEPIRWSGAIPVPDSCECLEIAEIVVTTSENAACAVAVDCPVNVQCDVQFFPNNIATRAQVAAFFYRYNGSPAFIPPTIPTFNDVPVTDPDYLEIEWAAANGILTGYLNGAFQPTKPWTTQQAAVSFYVDSGSPAFVPPLIPTFSDVPLDHPNYLEIEWSYAQGIFFGFGDGTFRPTFNMVRRNAAVAFYRYAGSPPYAPTPPPFFFDVPATDTEYLEIEWMHDQGIAFGVPFASSWQPIDWTLDESEAFPPADCNIFIQTVNGETPDTSPIRELVEVPFDEFIPDCGPFPVPPPPLALLGADCYCDPWVQVRKCCTFTNPADWNEATSYIEIFTGSSDLRNLKIEAYNNPFGELVPCPCDPTDTFWDCRTPCSTILVPQLPARSTLIIDSRQRIAQLVLASGRVVNALRYVYAQGGKPFEWFDIAQCSSFCMVLQADCNNIAEDATLRVGAVGRFVSSGW